MSKIDLSKAKIGDKFRTELGYIVIFTGLYKHGKKYKYTFDRVDDKYCGCFCDINGVPSHNKEMYTIVEQVFDEPIGTIARDIRTNHEMEEVIEVIKEEKQELQRKQEVLKYADMLFFNQKDTRIALFGYDVAIETAEIIVKSRDKYLKEGKLC